MLSLRYPRRWRVASLILMLFVLAATLVPEAWYWPGRQQLATWLVAADKWAHTTTFAGLSVWFAGLYQRQVYWRIGIGLAAFGVGIEICQLFVAYRSADVFDVVADTVGIAIGLTVALAGLGGWCLRLENWIVAIRARNG